MPNDEELDFEDDELDVKDGELEDEGVPLDVPPEPQPASNAAMAVAVTILYILSLRKLLKLLKVVCSWTVRAPHLMGDRDVSRVNCESS